MIRFEAEVVPLTKQWELVEPGEKTDRDLGKAMNEWCCDQLQEARHLCMQWLHSSDLRIDGDDVAMAVQEIREIGARHVRAAQQWVDFFKYLVDATDESVAYEKQQIAKSAEVFIEGWVEDFRDWARGRKRSAAALVSSPDSDPALPATGSSIVQEGTELRYRPPMKSDTGSAHLAPADQDLRVDESLFSVFWRGRACHLGNSRQFRLMEQLAAVPNRYHTFATLAERMGCDEDFNIRPVKHRLTTALKKASMTELANRICTQTEHYGLFLSA